MSKRTHIILTLLLAVALTSVLGACSSDQPMPGARAGNFMDDSYITTAVKTKLLGDTGLKSFDIKVITDNRVVTLIGTLPTAALRDQAITVAKSVDGVKDVVSQLEVKSD